MCWKPTMLTTPAYAGDHRGDLPMGCNVTLARGAMCGRLVCLIRIVPCKTPPKALLKQLLREQLWISRGGTLVLDGLLSADVLAAVVAKLVGMNCFYRIAHRWSNGVGPTVLWAKNGDWQVGELLEDVVAEETRREAEAKRRRRRIALAAG